MSSVRMCDTCGRIFSENEDGWATGTIQQMKRGARGAMQPVTMQQDACPQCNPAGNPLEMRPRIDLGGPPALPAAPARKNPYGPDVVLTDKGERVDYGEIERLEQELGIGTKRPE
jgi:hypothetical protein